MAFLRQAFIRLDTRPGVGDSSAALGDVAGLPVVADVCLGFGDLDFAGRGDVGILAFEGGKEVWPAYLVELRGVAVKFVITRAWGARGTGNELLYGI